MKNSIETGLTWDKNENDCCNFRYEKNEFLL